MTGWTDWQAHDRAYRSPYVDWEVALFDRLGRLCGLSQHVWTRRDHCKRRAQPQTPETSKLH